MVISSAIDRLESRLDYAPNEILSRTKPIYIKGKRWNSIRAKALEKKIKGGYGSRTDKAESYKLLCLSEKPDYLIEEEWLSLKDKAIALLKDELIAATNKAWDAERVLEVLNIERPLSFPMQMWGGIAA